MLCAVWNLSVLPKAPQHFWCAARQKSTGDLVAQGTHVEYPAGGDPYPGTIEEYHKLRVARQKSKL